jgi:hypothetical protein
MAMRPRWLVELEGQERAIVIVPGKVLFTLANVPEKLDGK